MEPERWQDVERIYHAALQCKESQRTAFVMEACAADQTLRAEVESLLQYAQRPAKFLKHRPSKLWPRRWPGIFAPSSLIKARP